MGTYLPAQKAHEDLQALLSNAFFSTLPEDFGCSSVSVGSSLVGQDTER
jgi:hypothetical protein